MSARHFAPVRSGLAPRGWLQALVLALLLGLLAGCGGGGGGGTPAPAPSSGTTTGGGTSGTTPAPTGPNVVAMVLDGGTDGSAFNSPFVTVTVCVPGTSQCQAIDHVLVDTGSSGLRLLASALASTGLPAEPAPGGGALGECAQFASGFSWGSVRRADIQVGGEAAANLPIQVINDSAPAYATVPAACTRTGTNFGTGQGAKGILGVGFAPQDCGPACVQSTTPNAYFACSTTGSCAGSLAPLSSQVTQPVTAFGLDSNGLALILPPVPATGVASLTGSLVFGIGTRDNNAQGSATVYAANTSGYFTTTYKGTRYASSFLDSGSNAIFFSDPSIPQCTKSTGFYCPPSPLSLSASITGAGAGGATANVGFTVTAVDPLPASITVAPVGGTAAGLGSSFDWGLPFFFGRTVVLALPAPYGPGPYWAF